MRVARRYGQFAGLGLALALTLGVAPARAAPKQAPPATPPSGFSRLYGAVPVSIGVVSVPEIPALNDALIARGYPPLSRLMPHLSASIMGAFANGLVVEPQYRFTIVATDQTTVTCHHVLLNAGYLVASFEDVAVYPMVGVGFGTTTVEIASAEVTGASFDAILDEPTGDALISSTTFIAHAGFAANLWGSGHGDFIGVRAGLLLAPVSSGWKRRGYNVYAGPPPPLSGGYMALAFGFRTPF